MNIVTRLLWRDPILVRATYIEFAFFYNLKHLEAQRRLECGHCVYFLIKWQMAVIWLRNSCFLYFSNIGPAKNTKVDQIILSIENIKNFHFYFEVLYWCCNLQPPIIWRTLNNRFEFRSISVLANCIISWWYGIYIIVYAVRRNLALFLHVSC